VAAYGFDRALVTDRAETAAMLVANNFHFENNCAVLSADGYPYDVAPTVLSMLRRNPQLQVFAIHDASVEGCALSELLRGPAWFPDPSIQVTDLGLRPRHAQQLGLVLMRERQRTVPEAVQHLLTPDDVQWLTTGNVAELAALRPARLMRAIFQGFARASGDTTGDGGGGDGGYVWVSDSGADIHAADSFG
jgi:hypothetical protein